MTKPITVDMLREKKACEGQVKKFQKLFGDSVIPTEELCVKHAMDFNLYWIIESFLPFSLKAYDDARASIWKASEYARTPLRKAYYDAKELLWKACKNPKAYDDELAPLWKDYADKIAPLKRDYEEACAKLFFKLWNEQ